MKLRMQIRFVDERTLLIHFIGERPNLRGLKFKKFVEKLEMMLGISLDKVKIILSPYEIVGGQIVEMNWARFDEMVFRIKDFVKVE